MAASLQLAPSPGERLRRLLVRAGWAAMGAHVLFLLAFAVLGIRVLALFNVASVACYAVVIACAMRGRLDAAVGLIGLEVVAHAALAIAWLGWASGFHYYIFALTQLMFAGSPRAVTRNVWLGIALCGLYVALDGAFADRAALHALDAGLLDALRKANLVTAFALIAYFAWFSASSVGEAEQRLRELATTDPLTELVNRRCMQQVAEAGVRHAERLGEPFAVLLIDIDHFKSINDTLGHEAGDRVLVEVARRLRDALGPAGSLARWGGEEFMVSMLGASTAQARATAERLAGAVADRPVTVGNRRIDLTVTIGTAQRARGETFVQCVARADAALYEGKRLGRNRVVDCDDAPAAPPAARAGRASGALA